jgi:hypothetical protein
MPAKKVRDLDPQKDNVYSWEDSWPGWDKNHLSFKACKELVHIACAAYDVEPPDVQEHKERTYSWSRPSTDDMSIQGGEHRGQGAKNVAIVLHETAHHIAWNLHGDRIQDHGRTFLGIYLDLLTQAMVAPRVALEASARAFKLKWK